jgi:hypothetical protein
MSGRKLLAMARAARRVRGVNPEWYASVRKMIHELRICNDQVRHFRRLFIEQGRRLYPAAHDLGSDRSATLRNPMLESLYRQKNDPKDPWEKWRNPELQFQPWVGEFLLLILAGGLVIYVLFG